MNHPLPPEIAAVHDRLYGEACRLLDRIIDIDGQGPRSPPGWFARRKLSKAAARLDEVLRLHPENWPAMFLKAKIHQRRGEWETALAWFRRAMMLAPQEPQATIAKEAGWMAGELGRHDEAVQLLQPAAQAKPDDPGLQVNLGLSLLFAGRAPEATAAFLRAADLEPSNDLNVKLARLAEDVSAGKLPRPRNQGELADAL